MRYLSLFSGIEACTVAWHPLGWTPVAFSEIEPFPCAVLAHHYPDVPNLGDVTKITEQDIKNLGAIDLVVFGSPCQSLSIAGKREGLIDVNGNITRSGLFFSAINIFHWAHEHCGARFALWENVKGEYSSSKGADFASVVSLMAGLDDLNPPENGWGTEGAAVGDNGLVEWGCLDAQWRNLAQRRERVFAILDTGDWSSRPPILLEPHSMRGDNPPSRKKGEEVAGTLASRVDGGGYPGTGGHVQPATQYGEIAGTLTADGFDSSPCADRGQSVVACFGGNNTAGELEVAPCQNTRGGNRLDFESDVFAVHSTGAGYWKEGVGTLRAREQESHEHLIAFPERMSATQAVSAENLSPSLGAVNPTAVAFSIQAGALRENPNSGPGGMGINQDVNFTLEARSEVGAVAFRAAGQDGFTPEDLSPPLTSTDGGGTVPTVCSVALRGREDGATAELGGDVSFALRSGGGGGDKPHVLANWIVRRLLPVECCRLMGFPDDYLDITFRKKPASDSVKYKSLGNSMAVPIMRYIGEQIMKAVEYEIVNRESKLAP